MISKLYAPDYQTNLDFKVQVNPIYLYILKNIIANNLIKLDIYLLKIVIDIYTRIKVTISTFKKIPSI